MPLSHLEWQTAHPTNRCWACANGAGVTTIYAYDDFGRRTSESSSAGETDYTWDSLGRLKGIASEDATSTYEYGPTGMRERAVVESANTTTTTECVWSGGTLVASRVSETQGGTTTVTDYRYLYGPDSLPLEMIVTPEGGTPSAYTFQCDRAGSVIALTDATGAAVATYTYDPWGALVEAPTTGVGARNPLRYRGYYLDDATGLYCLPARYYDPQTARFLSPDPAAPSAGDPLSLDRYAYCVGDPVNADDPSGAVIDRGGSTASSNKFYSTVAGGGYAAHLVANGSYTVEEAYQSAAKLMAGEAYQAWRARVDGAYARDLYGQAMAEMRTAGPVAARRAEEAIRSSWSTTDPHDDPTGYGLSAAGTTCAIFALGLAEECPPAAGLFAGASHTLGFAELGYTIVRFAEGRPGGTAADLTWATVGVVSVFGSVNPRTFKALDFAGETVGVSRFIYDTTQWF